MTFFTTYSSFLIVQIAQINANFLSSISTPKVKHVDTRLRLLTDNMNGLGAIKYTYNKKSLTREYLTIACVTRCVYWDVLIG